MTQEDRDAEAGRAVKGLRLSKNMTQEDLAAEANVDQSLLSKVERYGPRVTGWQTLSRIAAALDCELVIEFRPKK